MIKFSFLLLFLHTYLLANININHKAITIGLSPTLFMAQTVAKNLSQYDIYIYKTTTTQKPYFIMYAVNIKKENQKKALKLIQKKYKDAYISSDSRVQKLASVNYDKNILIKSRKHQKLDIDTNININKLSLFVTYAKNKQELFEFLKKYKNYDLFVERLQNYSIVNPQYCCALYIVNINADEFNSISNIMRYSHNEVKEEQTTFLKYRHERFSFNKFIQGYTITQ